MNIEQARMQMIGQQVRAWDVLDARVLQVMADVPRERFVPQRYSKLAFADINVPLAHGQVMMTPTVEGRMLQALDVRPGDTVLDIGTGSGFSAACLARLGGSVLSIDIHADFTEKATEVLASLGVGSVTLQTDDASRLTAVKKYDCIAVTGSLPAGEASFETALTIGGRLFVILGNEPVMQAMLITRLDQQEWSREPLFETVLPPLEHEPAAEKFVF